MWEQAQEFLEGVCEQCQKACLDSLGQTSHCGFCDCCYDPPEVEEKILDCEMACLTCCQYENFPSCDYRCLDWMLKKKED